MCFSAEGVCEIFIGEEVFTRAWECARGFEVWGDCGGFRVFEEAGQEAIPPPVYIYSCSNIFRRFWSVYQIGGQIFQDLGLSPRSSKSRGGYIHVPLRGTIVLYTCISVLSRAKNLKKDLTSLKYRYIL